MMKQIAFGFFALFGFSAVTACGFTPLYGGETAGNLVTVEEIEGRAGHALRKALLQNLAAGLPGLDQPAVLTIVLDEEFKRLSFQPDEAASRTDFQGEANYVLALDSDAVSGKVRAELSYNVPDAPFADITAQIDVSERTMTLLARRIVDDLRLKLAAKGQ